MFCILAIFFFIVNFILFGMGFISSDFPADGTLFQDLLRLDGNLFLDIQLFVILCWILLIILKNKLSQKYLVLFIVLVFNIVFIINSFLYSGEIYKTFNAWQQTQVKNQSK